MKDSERIEYLDTLKFIAIFCIISLHTFQIWNNGQQILNFDFYSLVGIVRFGVPIFLMITGALLLNRHINLKEFYRKKIIRICLPFLFFLIIQFCLFEKDMNIFIYNWYFWMILGVYLTIPIINKFVLHSTMDELRYFVLIIFVTSIIYQLMCFFKFRNFLDLNFFMGPLCYLILGYYFSKKEYNLGANKIITICLCLFLTATLLKIFGSLAIVPNELIVNFKANNTQIVSSWLDVGFVELVQTSSVFVMFRYLYKSKTSIYSKIKNVLEKNTIKKFIISVSKASYGMYLINKTMMSICKDKIASLSLTGTEICICFTVLTISIFLISWLIIVILSRIPFIKAFSGYA